MGKEFQHYIFRLFMLTAVCAALLAASPVSAEHNRKVLVLHSYHKGLGWTDSITEGIEAGMSRSEEPVEIHYEYMDTKRVFDDTHLENLARLLSHKYKNIDFTGIVSSDDHAFRFLLSHHQEIFPETPIVFCGVNGFRPEMIEGNPWFTGVIEALSFVETLEAALRIEPHIKTVYGVVDDTVTGRSNKKSLLDAMKQFQGRLEVKFLENRTMEEMKSVTAELPEDSVLVYLSFTTDSAGQKFSLEEGADSITMTANRPMYSFWDFHLGHGIIGGRLTHGYTQGETAAGLLLRTLKGEAPGDIPVIRESPNQYIFDHVVMARFGIDADRVPENSMVLNLPVSFLEQNRELIQKFGIVVFCLVLVIVVLSYNFVKLRLADESVRRSEERFREITELLPETIFEVNIDRELVFINKSGKEQFQIEEGEVERGFKFYSLFAAKEHERLDQRFKQFMDGKTLGLQEYIGVRGNGEEFPLIARSVPTIRDGKVVGIRGLLMDMSEKNQLEEQIRNAQRMESIGTLAGGIAHDFNNLLMGIQGRASLALTDTTSSVPVREHLEGIEEYVRSASNLTKQLLGFARSGTYDLKPTDINRLISNSSQMFGRTRKELQMLTRLEPDVWALEVDRSQIEQVLLNLYINSWQAMSGNGTITVKTENVVVDESEGEILSVRGGPYVRITVTDTGNGINREVKEHIFEPFFSTKERGRGTGLGLASAYGIIKNHKGSIYVVSEEGEGASFQIHLPARMVHIEEEAEADERLITGEGRLLLVDDEQMVLDVSEGLLSQLGYTVYTASNGGEALRIFEEHKGEICLVVLDMIMPGMSGEETFHRLREIDPDVRVLLSSGYSADGRAASLIGEGCNGFIQKPFDLQTLSRKVREVLDEVC
ncbi:ATP-binding protein [Desulfopila sp. IMCC35008]|uniref:ATP-binding protein n=1 Tax=Desulfopila sp. IMCC35008 TaxID=2653858 RepID=UPI0013D1EE6E|nr:ATP-binding protein [Desulfopila sp. IMCC35008]